MELLQQKAKEKSDMILEPLQVMIQLSLLAHSPLGTKISISNNILCLQQPTLLQGAIRWFNSDNKDDLYYLFHAIRRFYKWYTDEDDKIFSYILIWAIKGIEKLIETYTNSDKKSILHTLTLYKNILLQNSGELFSDENEHAINMDKVFKNIGELYDRRILIITYNGLKILEDETNETFKKDSIQGIKMMINPMNVKIHKWINENLTC